jgi:hypothetical protein
LEKSVKEKKGLRSKEDGDSKPHKDNPHYMDVKQIDQQNRKDQPKYDMNRDKRYGGIKMTIKKKEDNEKKHERFSSTKNERFSTTKDALEWH